MAGRDRGARAPVGPLTAAAAEHLGLARSTLVVQGGVDAFIGMIGLGVAREGQLALVTGSSHLQLAVTSRPVAVRGLWGSYANAVYPGRHVLEGGQTSSGSMIAWLRRFAGDDADLARLNQEAALLPPDRKASRCSITSRATARRIRMRIRAARSSASRSATLARTYSGR